MRAIELTLAGLISTGALSATFVTDASSHGSIPDQLPTPRFDASQFAKTEASASSRAAVAAVLSRSTTTRRLLPADDHFNEDGEAGRLSVTPDVTVHARSVPSAVPDWSGSAMGVQVTARTRAVADLPPIFLVGGAGQETYMISPNGPLNYTLAPAGVEASVGDAHIGVGMQLNDRVYATVGYVREQRRYSAGARDWTQDEHYVGIGLRARW